MMLRIATIFNCCALVSSTGLAGWFGPSNYSECVEKYVKGAKSNRAAVILNYTCRMEFDQQKRSTDWKNYYDCVRGNLEDVEQDSAALFLLRSCQEKHAKLFYQEVRPLK
jgi:hypothetical protein